MPWKRAHCPSMPPNKRTIVMKDSGEDHNEELPHDGDLLVVKRVLIMQVKDKDEVQRENIFHTKCLIQRKVFSMIIDGGICTNVTSTTLVKKLNLHTTKHHMPYKLQWLTYIGEVKVEKEV
ncbi:hypothetical protein CR513_38338, partial [Mucuna pruriens]